MNKPQYIHPTTYLDRGLFAELSLSLDRLEAKRESTVTTPGMTLRQHYAGIALDRVLKRVDVRSPEIAAQHAVAIADALIAELAK